MEHPTHPLVEKAVRGWLKLAADYGVKATVRRGESSWDPTAVIVSFEGRFSSDSGGVWIFAPSVKGGRVRQSPMIWSHYRGRGGKMKYGSKPGLRLRDLSYQIIWSWSPTASERLRAQAERSRVLVAA